MDCVFYLSLLSAGIVRRSRSNRRAVPNPNLGGLIPLPPRSPLVSPPPSPPQPQSTPPPLIPSSPASDDSKVDSHESWMDALPSPGPPAVTTRSAAATAAIISLSSSSDSDSDPANSAGSSPFFSSGEKVAAAVLLGWTAANAVRKNREDDRDRAIEIVKLLRKGSMSRLDAFKRLEYLDKESRRIGHLLICFKNAVVFGKPDVFLKECDKDKQTSQICSEAVMRVAEVLESQFELVLVRLGIESPLLGLLTPGSLETTPTQATVEQILRLKYKD